MNVREVSTLLEVHPLIVLAIEKQMSLEDLLRIEFHQTGLSTSMKLVLQLYKSTDSPPCKILCIQKIDQLLIHQLRTGAFDASALEEEFGIEIDDIPCSEEVREQCYQALDKTIVEELETEEVSPTRADYLGDRARSKSVQDRCRTLSDRPYVTELERGNCTPERIVTIYQRVWTTYAKELAIRQLLHL